MGIFVLTPHPPIMQDVAKHFQTKMENVLNVLPDYLYSMETANKLNWLDAFKKIQEIVWIAPLDIHFLEEDALKQLKDAKNIKQLEIAKYVKITMMNIMVNAFQKIYI